MRHKLSKNICSCIPNQFPGRKPLTIDMPRDDFSKPLKDALAKRVGLLCSNPACKAATSGPHTDANKSISLGVAAHITAASPGGPRYALKMTSEERSSIENAIWLCQNCAKLVDTDSTAFSLSTLYRWKINAESEALRTIGGTNSIGYFPQPASAVHAPLPRIGGQIYDTAREMLIQAGWQPYLNHWSKASEWDMTVGNGLYFWNKGFHEIRNACPTGLGQCTFAFKDVYGNLLLVVTAGEADDELNATPCVWNWRFEREEPQGVCGIYV